jgi:uncharacterized protein YecT (DUF1311 family)
MQGTPRQKTKYLRVLRFALFLGIGSPCLAQYSASYQVCSQTSMTQSEMNRCANEELTRVETRLNTTYAKLLTFVSADQPSTEKIRAAERAWITYRDAYIDAKYPAVDKQAAYDDLSYGGCSASR